MKKIFTAAAVCMSAMIIFGTAACSGQSKQPDLDSAPDEKLVNDEDKNDMPNADEPLNDMPSESPDEPSEMPSESEESGKPSEEEGQEFQMLFNDADGNPVKNMKGEIKFESNSDSIADFVENGS